MFEIIIDALKDSLTMVPLLLIVYIGIELIENKWGNKIKANIQKAGKAGPAVGAIGGSLPQCGFSVIVTALYTQRLVTIGTLLAVYLSTSDEAIPIILSHPDKAHLIIPIVLTKIFIAITAGYVIDFTFRKNSKKTLLHIEAYKTGKDKQSHNHSEVNDKTACCGHKPSANLVKFNPKEAFLHPLIHTVKIFLFIFLISVAINSIIFVIGEKVFNDMLANNLAIQPVLAALVGLIPNCASSVVITELYLKGSITYGAVIAGLSASGGLGILVLLKEDKNRKEALKIIGLLFGISVLVGLVIQFVGLNL